MSLNYSTIVSAIGPEVGDLLEGGVLILFGAGAPPELAEIAVTHTPQAVSPEAPKPGDKVTIGDLSITITAVGASAWNKMVEIGHVSLCFTGAASAERPGEISVEVVPAETVLAKLAPGARITFAAA